MRKLPLAAVVFLGALSAALLISGWSAPAAGAALPSGPYGTLIQYGRDLIERTPQLMPGNVGAAMSCEACHNAAGTRAHAGSLVGLYAEFPQWNPRAKRFISLQDRIAECFLYSENGRPPAYTSREMEAITAYIAWLSNGRPVGRRVVGYGLEKFTPPHPADPQHGAQVYAQRCETCHGADGAGRNGAFPPLWGTRSFNDGAGMSHVPMMAGFVRYAMPYGAKPNTLTPQEAYDVAAFVLSHPRPHFDGARAVGFPPIPAKDF
ncbi:MAG TPA: c-type cytochrome [Candidatus Limnocylindria bacterium]|nr:c-type cytochrome [Candidatus Limnocylindria bacterium]